MPADGSPPTPPPRKGARSRTESMARFSRAQLEIDARLYPERPGVDYHRPRTLADCDAQALGTRHLPCPFVSCKHNLYLDVNERTGSIKRNFPGLEIDEIPATCALRVAAEGGRTLDGVALVANITRERTRQIETQALARLRAGLTSAQWTALDDALDHADGARQ